jgi:hypothetical protein
MPAAPWFVLTTDVESDGFLAGITDSTPAPQPRFIRNGTEPRVIHLLEQNGSDITEIDYSDLTSLAVGVGVKDKPPTSGTFALTVNSTTDDLTALSYDISASALQTALNANSGVTAAGGVTVTKTGATDVSPLYVITGEHRADHHCRINRALAAIRSQHQQPDRCGSRRLCTLHAAAPAIALRLFRDVD